MADAPTQQTTFDLSAFRKEIERRFATAEHKNEIAARLGHEEDEAHSGGAAEALEGVLALLPGEGETDG